MLTLKEHNEKKRRFWKMLNPIIGEFLKGSPNGIKCDICGHELVDIDQNSQLTSMPPQVRVRCPNCGYSGTRIA